MTITPYSSDGQLLQSQSRQIAPNQKFIGVARVLGLPQQTAWFKIDASAPITGFELFGYDSGSSPVDVTGTWDGTWYSEDGSDGSFTARISQSGNQVSGTMDVGNTDCGDVYGVPFTGTVSGNTITFDGSYNCQGHIGTLEFTQGTIPGNKINGIYHLYVDGIIYDNGTFAMTKR